MGKRDEDEPSGGCHHQVGSAHGLLVLAGHGNDGECKEDEHRADPADGRRDVSGEREPAQTGSHHHRESPGVTAACTCSSGIHAPHTPRTIR